MSVPQLVRGCLDVLFAERCLVSVRGDAQGTEGESRDAQGTEGESRDAQGTEGEDYTLRIIRSLAVQLVELMQTCIEAQGTTKATASSVKRNRELHTIASVSASLGAAIGDTLHTGIGARGILQLPHVV